MFLFTLLILLAFIQLIAIVIHGYILLRYKKYCGHCDWWSDLGAGIFFAYTFLPVIGILAPIVGPIDYMRNVYEESKKEHI